MVAFLSTLLAIAATMAVVEASATNVIVNKDDPSIWYHGRWDYGQGSWWTGTGFTLNVKDLSSISIQLGPNTTSPTVAVGLSVNYGPFVDLQLINGTNSIPLTTNATVSSTSHSSKSHNTVLRFATEGWQNNNMYLEKIILNSGAKLLPYTPSRLTFQFIGDSLSAGQYVPNGVIGAWPFLLSEAYKAEQRINAQPGACLTDQVCWGNAHGLTYEFFKTEDTGYYYNPKHNFTTNWDFRKDGPATHVFLEAGANDNAYSVPSSSLIQTFLDFIEKIRHIYPTQPIFVLSPWGWPSADGSVSYYYEDVFGSVVNQRNAQGDKHVYLVNATGWIDYSDIYPDNSHPNPKGHGVIASKMEEWLKIGVYSPSIHGLRSRTKAESGSTISLFIAYLLGFYNRLLLL